MNNNIPETPGEKPPLRMVPAVLSRISTASRKSFTSVGTLSLRNKLVVLNVLATLVALTITFVLITYIQVSRARDEMVREMNTVAQVFADNVVTLLAFADSKEGHRALSLIESLPLVHKAVLYDDQGLEFARFQRPKTPDYEHQVHPLEYEGVPYREDYLHTIVPVSHDGDELGSLYIRTSTESLDRHILYSFMQLVLILAITTSISTFAAVKLQAVLLAPILHLVEVMRRIVTNQDYSIRVTQKSHDETDMLYVGFNSMLDHIQDRESHLEQVNFDLQLERYRAEAASQSKSEFLAKMSHEIRTPLNGILSLADLMLMEDDLSEEYKEDLNTIRMSAHSLKTIINDVLDFSKIEAGRLVLESTAFSLRKLIEDTVKILSIESRNAEQTLVCEMTSAVPDNLLGDPTRIQQVLTNLIGNAIKFTPQGGGIIVYADAKQKGDNSAIIHLGVADTGIGIPESKFNAIFDSFTQADDTTTRRYGGTGLGLTICKRLVTMMEGQIWLDSKVNTGTTFHVMLELPLADPTHKKEGELTVDDTTSRLQCDVPLKVLIAEDNEVNRETMTRFLEVHGYIPHTVSNGLEALEELQNSHFDVILLDLQMPLMGGIEAARYIRESNFSSKDVPIIAVTADAVKGNEDICLAAGMDGFVTKPIDYPNLFKLIHEKLRQGPSRDGSSATTSDGRATTDISWIISPASED